MGTSVGGYNDAKWHHSVWSFGPTGCFVMVDGITVGTAGPFPGYDPGNGEWAWGCDGDACDGVNPSYPGNLSDLAVYTFPLSQTRAAAHYAARGVSSQYQSAVLADNPFGYSPADDVVGSTALRDISGHGRPLTVRNGVALGGVGPNNGSVYLDGGACTGLIFNSYAGPLNGASQLTMEMWFRTGAAMPPRRSITPALRRRQRDDTAEGNGPPRNTSLRSHGTSKQSSIRVGSGTYW